MSAEIQDTREKILLTACRLFAESGFEGVTHRELAKEAGVNSALINYYFGSKEQLFEDVLEYTHQLSLSKYPIPVNEDIDPLDGIIEIAKNRLLSVFDDDPEGWFPKLVSHEMNSLNSNKDLIRNRYLKPMRGILTKFVAKYLNDDEKSLAVMTAVFNISSQWIMMNVARSRGKGFFKDKKLTAEEKKLIIDRVIGFIKGGLQESSSSI